MESRFLEVNGVRMHVSDFGGKGPALLMLHSTGFGSWMWAPIVDELSQSFRLFALEQRGHGDTDKPEDGYSYETFAADIDGVLDELGLDQVYGLGHSSGATSLMTHASLYPGRIRRLLMVEPALVWPHMRPAGVPSAARARKRRAGFPSREAMFESFQPRAPFNTWQERVLRLYCEEGTLLVEGGVVLKCPPELEARYFEASALFDPTPHLQRLRVPVSFLWGDRGNRDRNGEVKPESFVLGAESKSIAGASHFLPMEKPELVVREARAFFKEES